MKTSEIMSERFVATILSESEMYNEPMRQLNCCCLLAFTFETELNANNPSNSATSCDDKNSHDK